MRVGIILDNEILNDNRVLNEIELMKDVSSLELFLLSNTKSNDKVQKQLGFKCESASFSNGLVSKLRPLLNTIPLYSLLWKRKIKKFVLDNRIECLHVHDLYMLQPVLAAKTGVPIVVDLHESFPEAINTYVWANKFPKSVLVKPKKWKEKEKVYLASVNKIITLSLGYQKQLQKEYPNLEDHVFCQYPNIPNFSRLEKNKNTGKYKLNSKFTFFYFGVIADRRGFSVCIEALKLLGDDVEFLLIGPIDSNEEKKIRGEISRDSRITYIPWIDIDELSGIVSYVDVCLSPIEKNPQHESGVANKVFQYMYLGKPVIVSNCIPQQEVVEKANAGLSYKHDSPEELAQKITFFIENNEKGKEMGSNGRKFMNEEMNFKSYVQVFENLYSDVKSNF